MDSRIGHSARSSKLDTSSHKRNNGYSIVGSA